MSTSERARSDAAVSAGIALARQLQLRSGIPNANNEPRRTKMTTSTNTTKTGLTIKTSIKAGGLGTANHNRGLSVRSAIKAGGLGTANHNRGLAVRSAVKAGGLSGQNHNRGLSSIR